MMYREDHLCTPVLPQLIIYHSLNHLSQQPARTTIGKVLLNDPSQVNILVSTSKKKNILHLNKLLLACDFNNKITILYIKHLHHRHCETPPCVTERVPPPQGLWTVHIAHRDDHWKRGREKCFFTQIKLNIQMRQCILLKSPVCKARKPAMIFWIKSSPLDNSPNHCGPSSELYTLIID